MKSFQRILVVVVTGLLLLSLAEVTAACGRRAVVYCPPCCWVPCCPPDMTPLNPPPPHPNPGSSKHELRLKNQTYSEAFVIIYLRYPDGIYRVYDKKLVMPGTTPLTNQTLYVGDHLLVETWSRGTPTDYWHCRCRHLITLSGRSSDFDVIHCHHFHP